MRSRMVRLLMPSAVEGIGRFARSQFRERSLCVYALSRTDLPLLILVMMSVDE
jgi:hypothetical protein